MVFSVLATCLMVLGCSPHNPDPDKAHHTKNGFRNADGPEGPGLADILKWRFTRSNRHTPRPGQYHFTLAGNDPAFLKANRNRNTVTWIGHATLLLQLEGKNILTDPQFSARASPVSWAGPRRVVAPGIALEDLPPIDIVLISHDHYDSLDGPTIRKLVARAGGTQTRFFVPLGLKAWFSDLGITRVVELDWWEQYREGDLNIIATPVRHWSKRGLFSRNKTLWAGWIVESAGFRFFFAGDSGYTKQFKEIGKRYGPFDLAAIPIGAYEPRWIMRNHHLSPEEAVLVHQDIRSKRSVAIHWGTFILTDEPLDEPPLRLEQAKQAEKIPARAFLVLKHGETLLLDRAAETPPSQ